MPPFPGAQPQLPFDLNGLPPEAVQHILMQMQLAGENANQSPGQGVPQGFTPQPTPDIDAYHPTDPYPATPVDFPGSEQADMWAAQPGNAPETGFQGTVGPQDLLFNGQGPAPVIDNAQMAPQGPAPIEPLPPDRLFRMYLAWEYAKVRENWEGYMARRYYHGKQWTEEELKVLKKRRQPPVTANRINRKVDFLVGVEQRLRRDAKAYPRRPDQEHGAWIATAALRFVQDQNHWPAVASEGTHQGLVSGIGCVYQGIEIKKGQPEIRSAAR
jgi:hypothetical protein